jgi:non-ribosomal peptide synthetase component F
MVCVYPRAFPWHSGLPRPWNDQDACQCCGVSQYDSGDLARFSSDGEIVCCGRADYQVKINGFRIELGYGTAAEMISMNSA